MRNLIRNLVLCTICYALIFGFSPLVGAQTGTHTITITWTGNAADVTYNLQRGTTSGGEVRIASGLTGSSFDDKNLPGSTKFWYTMTGVNSAGVESPPSAETSCTTFADIPAPVTPGAVSCKATN